jgi:hypothetical protein
MTIQNIKKIEDILNKYMWELCSYRTNIDIYNDLIKELPELKHIHINLYDILTWKEWADYGNKAINLRKIIDNRNKIIDSIING